MSESSERGKEAHLIPFNEQEATAVNRFLGIRKEGVLSPEEMPGAIDVSSFWKATKPILDRYPRNKEVFIGWEQKGGVLEAVEENEGKGYGDIVQKSVDIYIGRTIVGIVSCHPHLLMLHSHPEIPREVLEKYQGKNPSAVKRFIKDIPQTGFDDIRAFLKQCREYAEVIIDVFPKEGELMPILVVLKTSKSPVITRENYYRYEEKFENIFYRERLGFDGVIDWRDFIVKH